MKLGQSWEKISAKFLVIYFHCVGEDMCHIELFCFISWKHCDKVVKVLIRELITLVSNIWAFLWFFEYEYFQIQWTLSVK